MKIIRNTRTRTCGSVLRLMFSPIRRNVPMSTRRPMSGGLRGNLKYRRDSSSDFMIYYSILIRDMCDIRDKL